MPDYYPEFLPEFCMALNEGTMHCDALNDLAWSVLDYALDGSVQ